MTGSLIRLNVVRIRAVGVRGDIYGDITVLSTVIQGNKTAPYGHAMLHGRARIS